MQRYPFQVSSKIKSYDDGNQIESKREPDQNKRGAVLDGKRLLRVYRLGRHDKNMIRKFHELIQRVDHRNRAE